MSDCCLNNEESALNHTNYVLSVLLDSISLRGEIRNKQNKRGAHQAACGVRTSLTEEGAEERGALHHRVGAAPGGPPRDAGLVTNAGTSKEPDKARVRGGGRQACIGPAWWPWGLVCCEQLRPPQ